MELINEYFLESETHGLTLVKLIYQRIFRPIHITYTSVFMLLKLPFHSTSAMFQTDWQFTQLVQK